MIYLYYFIKDNNKFCENVVNCLIRILYNLFKVIELKVMNLEFFFILYIYK